MNFYWFSKFGNNLNNENNGKGLLNPGHSDGLNLAHGLVVWDSRVAKTGQAGPSCGAWRVHIEHSHHTRGQQGGVVVGGGSGDEERNNGRWEFLEVKGRASGKSTAMEAHRGGWYTARWRRWLWGVTFRRRWQLWCSAVETERSYITRGRRADRGRPVFLKSQPEVELNTWDILDMNPP
jgi:hypothetical protein